MEKLLELASKKVDWAEVFYIKKNYASINFKNGCVYNMEEEQEEGVTLRIRKNGKTGFTSTTTLEDRKSILEMALNVLSVSEECPFEIPHYKDGDYPFVQCYDEKLVVLPEEHFVGVGEKIIETVRSKKPSISISAEVGRSENTIRIMNTSDISRSYDRTFYSVSLSGTMVTPEEQLEIESYFSNGSYVEDLTPFSLKFVEDMSNSEKYASLKGGPMNVIFSPRGFKTIYPPLYMAFNGDRVGNKTSPLSDRMGEQVGPDFLTVVDDNTAPFGSLSGPMDDEGTPGERTELIENGTVKGFYYDLKSAARYNVKSTGNGIKKASLYEGFKLTASPGCHASNFLILPGNKPPVKLMEGVERALIVEDVLGAGQGNNMSGEFSVNVLLGFLWDRGEIRGRVKNVMVSGNVFQTLKNLRWLASDNRWEHSFFGTYNVPTMCFSDINVVVKE